MNENRIVDSAIAAASIGGNNAHGSGFLAAGPGIRPQERPPGRYPPGPQDDHVHIGRDRLRRDVSTGEDLRAETVERKVGRAAPWIPREEWADPLRLPLVFSVTGIPGVFRPYRQAVAEHIMAQAYEAMTEGRIPWTTPQSLTETFFPARLVVPH